MEYSAAPRFSLLTAKARDLTVIDAANENVVRIIELDVKPEFAASDGKGGALVFGLPPAATVGQSRPERQFLPESFKVVNDRVAVSLADWMA